MLDKVIVSKCMLNLFGIILAWIVRKTECAARHETILLDIDI